MRDQSFFFTQALDPYTALCFTLPNLPTPIPKVHFKLLQVKISANQLDTQQLWIGRKASIRIWIPTSNIQKENKAIKLKNEAENEILEIIKAYKV